MYKCVLGVGLSLCLGGHIEYIILLQYALWVNDNTAFLTNSSRVVFLLFEFVVGLHAICGVCGGCAVRCGFVLVMFIKA